MRLLLLPFSWLYAFVVDIRNWLFDNELLYTWCPPVCTISVGNLSVGGTGKTPHTIALIEMLKSNYKIAVLSRGYKRKTRGFYLADNNTNATIIGDEPMQIHLAFPDILVAVSENRVYGIKKILEKHPDVQIIILDDAFQHRYVKPHYSILLTAYNDLYVNDRMLPAGNLRESKIGSLRADMVVVTKCPNNITPIDMRTIDTTLGLPAYQSLYFSHMQYGKIKPVFLTEHANVPNKEITKETEICMFTGIATPLYMQQYLQQNFNTVESLLYPDHCNFNKRQFDELEKRFLRLNADNRIIITTEKDAARLLHNRLFPSCLKPYLYQLPIKTQWVREADKFEKEIKKIISKKS